MGFSRIIKDTLGHRCLARINVGHDTDISDFRYILLFAHFSITYFKINII